ncbi:hypothetical protein GCM10027610_013390 [Dactylosporangium cerinum]
MLPSLVGWARRLDLGRIHAIAWTSELAPGPLAWVSATDADLALRYLADVGFTPIGPSRWRWDDTPSEEMSDEDVAFHTAFEITTDEGLDGVQRVHTALGLLDLTGAFEVLIHLNAYVLKNPDPAVADAFWAGFRDRMAVPEPIEHLRLHLRTYWFWGHDTAKTAFDALLGDDVRHLAADGRLPELAAGPVHLRARHVLEDSGSVDWDDKRDVYQAAATVTALRPAVFRALLGSYHAVSGSLDPAAALTLLDSLHLPADTEHLTQLHAVLRNGVANHYKDPAAWRP